QRAGVLEQSPGTCIHVFQHRNAFETLVKQTAPAIYLDDPSRPRRGDARLIHGARDQCFVICPSGRTPVAEELQDLMILPGIDFCCTSLCYGSRWKGAHALTILLPAISDTAQNWVPSRCNDVHRH